MTKKDSGFVFQLIMQFSENVTRPGLPPVNDHRKRPSMGFKMINKLLTGCSTLLVNTVKSNTYTRSAMPSESSIFTCTKIFSVISTLKQIINILDQVNGFP